MSKAFTKDDAVEAPLVVPARAPLPPGVPNYVTARGLRLLREELVGLEAERARLEAAQGDQSDDEDRKHRLAVVTGRITELAARVASATLVDPRTHPQDEVRFGATVTLRAIVDGDQSRGEERRYRIVGVDEADAAHGRIAFIAPLARALLGRRAGETTTVRTGRGEETLELVSVTYDDE